MNQEDYFLEVHYLLSLSLMWAEPVCVSVVCTYHAIVGAVEVVGDSRILSRHGVYLRHTHTCSTSHHQQGYTQHSQESIKHAQNWGRAAKLCMEVGSHTG